ncbi:MAG: cation-translocating P-type ATPase [Alphaproteobacteria bacterium]|uniref:P-type Zn(2+) transporter n=1 Tax=Candidatus Nitrobium versatile TaxID=2884831 RepID=A0A953J8G8_9BACT|nr:cation-translocating P-type ATPase [Candidatus Nitrobium versatile]
MIDTTEEHPEIIGRKERGKQETCSLAVKGLDCATCAEKVQRALMHHRGVLGVTIYLGTERVDVQFDPSVINKKAIIGTLNELGIKVAAERGAHEHDHGGGASRRFELLRIAGVLFLVLLGLAGVGRGFLQERGGLIHIWDIAAILIGGYPLLRHAFIDLKEKAITADVFMALGVVSATAIGEFRSAAVISLFMLIAEFLDSFTMDRSRSAIRDLVGMAPKTARVKRGETEVEIPVEEVKKGDIVLVKPGEKIPVEGIIVSGSSFVNQAPITGESLPVEKKEGESVYAATINQHGILFVKVTHTGEDTTYARIIKLVEEAESSKAQVQKVADKFAAYFTPAILVVAVLTLLLTGKLTNAIAVLVVACPCTVAIATPLAVVAGMGKAAKRGIIIKGGRYLEALAKVDTLVMDKTGTLTIGDPVVTDIKGFSGHSDEEIIAFTAGTERYSEHPLARAIMKKALEIGIKIPEPDQCCMLPGMGIEAVVQGSNVLFGSRELLLNKSIHLSAEVEKYIAEREEEGKTVLLLAQAGSNGRNGSVGSNGHNGMIIGVISVADIVREGTAEAIAELREMGFHEPVMLTGDNQRTAHSIAATLGIEKVMFRLLPEDKVKKIKELVAGGRQVLMVGDGINDAPALAQAHVGVAMGAVGSDAAIEASDVALMRDEWKQIPEAIRIGRSTFSVIRQNIALGILFNVVGIALASVGILSPVGAAVAHIMPDVLVFLNSSRLLK